MRTVLTTVNRVRFPQAEQRYRRVGPERRGDAAVVAIGDSVVTRPTVAVPDSLRLSIKSNTCSLWWRGDRLPASPDRSP